MKKCGVWIGFLWLLIAEVGVAESVNPQLGGDTTKVTQNRMAFTFPAANMARRDLRRFFFGNRLFNTNWVVAPASVASL